eukprot:TRINITY_DN6811_c0_g4_i1.p1 TRINITY_DN6811_c0_g4~~TRINITY_DN6811_c0_g4_i1.p1  ORF type:complete len:113 (-),score=3.46 TRINITY_DN6811_c0_g4_i1:333-671(-)
MASSGLEPERYQKIRKGRALREQLWAFTRETSTATTPALPTSPATAATRALFCLVATPSGPRSTGELLFNLSYRELQGVCFTFFSIVYRTPPHPAARVLLKVHPEGLEPSTY